jgi:hypothetical protein
MWKELSPSLYPTNKPTNQLTKQKLPATDSYPKPHSCPSHVQQIYF